jgi:hypothetical protein
MRNYPFDCQKTWSVGAAEFLLSKRERLISGCILPVSGGAELGYRR